MSTGRSNSGKEGRFKSTVMKKIAKNANRNHSSGQSTSKQTSMNQFVTKEEVNRIQETLAAFGQTFTIKGNYRSIGSKNKHETDSDYEEEQQRMTTPKSGPPKRGKFADSMDNVAKQVKEMGQSLKNLSKYSNNGRVDIVNSLEDLESTDDENDVLTEIGRQIDAHVNSAKFKRTCAENELSISHECPLYKHIGTLDQVFQLKKPEALPKSNENNKNEGAHIFECIFLAKPQSTWYNSLIKQFKVEATNGIKMDFNNFMVVFCYVFQLRPNQIGISLDGLKMEEEMQMKKLEQMGRELDEGKFRVNNEKTKNGIISGNINLFFELWNNLDFFFKSWKEIEISALLRAFCYIYFEKNLVDDRDKVKSAIENMMDHLVGDENSDNQKLDNVLFKFGHRGMLQCAEFDWNRVWQLFALFSKFVQFKAQHKLSTVYALLQYVISQKIDQEKPSLRECTLGQVFQLFPEAIKCLKERNNPTDLHCVYTKLMDELTLDEKMLNDQSEESLREANENFNETSSSLNKRDINQKMVDMWSESHHRIRRIIQDRRNAAILENGKTEAAKKANKYYGGGGGLGSSSEEEDE